jgi:hypothetical protein
LTEVEVTNVTSPQDLAIFLLEPSREIVMGLEGCFYGFGLWKMKFLNIPLIFAGFVLLGICVPATYRTIYYGFKGMKEEQGLLIQQKKKNMDAAGIEPVTTGCKTSTQATKLRRLVHIDGIIPPFG